MSKKRTIRRRGLSAGLSVLLCLSMRRMGALAEEPDGSEDAARNTIVEKADTENIENTTDNDAVVENAIVEDTAAENDTVVSSDDAMLTLWIVMRMLLTFRLLSQNTLIRFAAAGTPAQTRIMPATRLSRTGCRSAVKVSCRKQQRTDTTI